MRENKTTDKLAKIFRINIGRTLKSIKEFITIRENLMMKEAAALRPEHCGILCRPSVYHPPLTRAVVAVHSWYWLLVAKEAISQRIVVVCFNFFGGSLKNQHKGLLCFTILRAVLELKWLPRHHLSKAFKSKSIGHRIMGQREAVRTNKR